MSKIKHEGTFVGYAMQSGVGETKANQYPQWIAKLQAVQEYDFDGQSFIDISETDEVEATAYLVLFDKDGKVTLNAKQIKEAYKDSGIDNWSLKVLNETDFSQIPIQFRIEEHEYNDKKSFQVSWIDHVDAVPGGSVGKMDDSKVSSLDAKFAGAFRELNGGDKPKSVPTSPAKTAAAKPAKPKLPTKPAAPAAPAKEETEKEPSNKALAQELAKAAVAEQKERAAAAEYAAMSPKERKEFDRKKKTAAAKPPVKPKAGPPKTTAAPPVEEDGMTPAQEQIAALDLPVTCSQDEAWDVCDANAHESKKEQLAEFWTGVVKEFGNDDIVEANQAWGEVRDRVLEQVILED